MSEGEPRSRASLAEKLDQLFKAAHGRGDRELTYQEVADGVMEQSGVKISPSYIWELRTGATTNPRKAHMEALARFFKVSPVYFYEDEQGEQIYERLESLVTIRDSSIGRIAARAGDLSPRGQELIANIIEQVARQEEEERRQRGETRSPEVNDG